jgi:glucokinase
MKTKKRILGIDMGGTSIKAGIIENGNLVEALSVPTPAKASSLEVINTLEDFISGFDPSSIEAIGIGVPTIVDVEKGIVYNATNIKDWKEVHLKQILEEHFGIPVFVNNDANCFVAGEKHFGKAKGYKSVVGLILGTGLGAGLIINDRLYEGRNCGAGELGNIQFKDRNFEYYCCGQYFRDELKIPAHEASRLASEGNSEAIEMYRAFGMNLGKFLQAVVYAYDPQLIVFGGSVSKAYRLFSESMFQSLAEGFIFPNSLKKLEIEVSEMENIAIYGAASLIYEGSYSTPIILA